MREVKLNKTCPMVSGEAKSRNEDELRAMAAGTKE